MACPCIYSTLSPSPTRPQRTRRTRFVCISDTHNHTVKLPKGDVLIHCGDLTNQGSYNELSKQVEWLEQADFECKIVVAGNHDLTLDTDFYNKHGAHRFNATPQVPADCQALLTGAKTLTYLVHERHIVKLTSPSGPRTTFSVFGSPYSPAWGGEWAYQYSRDEDAKALWAQIPLDTDILITHGPAHTHCDQARSQEAAGCEVLRRQIWRVRPRLALCGHIHEARGAERVVWDFDESGNVVELERDGWEDPHPDDGKNSLVDLSARGRKPLDNYGCKCSPGHEGGAVWGSDTSSGEGKGKDVVAYPDISILSLGEDRAGLSRSNRALPARLGRRETCFVNCAIQHLSYQRARGMPRRLNKPIVVDLDLPVWEEVEEPHDDE
ncbi:Metallo-dependent phosphatase-like protein [Xylaria sp. CBS 124048]|nr:Metallo-dependent phosphatase-like protein [Xylaria sp. CBS 124048]